MRWCATPSSLAALLLAACGTQKLPPEGSGTHAERLTTDFSVLEHHMDSSRRGVYVHPSFTRIAAATIRLEFSTPIEGVVNAQPLFLDGQGREPDLVLVATMKNQVFAINGSNGSLAWRRVLDPPLPQQVLFDILGPCGSFDPIGITGTPVIDAATRRMYFDLVTPEATRYAKHLIYALDLRDGSTLPGWPVDVASSVPGFRDIVQHQRGALTLLGGRVYIPYGGYSGDCGDYRGWVIGISTSNPTSVGAWRPGALGAGIWAPSGVASDGTSLFVATGNATDLLPEWNGNHAIIRLGQGPTFSGLPADYFAPKEWPALDQADQDLGSSGVTLFDLPQAGLRLAAALGKDANIHLVDRSNLGGIGGSLLTQSVSSFVIITAPSVYTNSLGTFVVFSALEGRGIDCPGEENITTLRVDPTSPLSLSTAWCARVNGFGSTMVTTSDGAADSVVWVVGAKGDNRLYGFDGDTGTLIAMAEGVGNVSRYTAPMAAKGRIYVGAEGRLDTFTVLSAVDEQDGGTGRDGGMGQDGGTGQDAGAGGGGGNRVRPAGRGCGTAGMPFALISILLARRKISRGRGQSSTRREK